MSLSPTLKRLLTGSIVLVVGVFFASALRRNWDNLGGLDLSIGVLNAASYALFVAAIIVSGVLWNTTFRSVSKLSSSPVSGTLAHFEAWLLKYIPGQIGALLSKLSWGSRQGASKTTTALAFAYENLFLTLASTVPVAPIILLGSDLKHRSLLFAAYMLGLLLVYLLMRSKAADLFITFASKVTKSDLGPESLLSPSKVLSLSATFTSSRILNGAAFVLLAEAVADVSSGDYVFLASAYVMAGIIGIWAIFVPSGLGVREGVLVALTAPLLGLEVAISLSLIVRLYTTLTDVAVAALYGLGRMKGLRK